MTVWSSSLTVTPEDVETGGAFRVATGNPLPEPYHPAQGDFPWLDFGADAASALVAGGGISIYGVDEILGGFDWTDS